MDNYIEYLVKKNKTPLDYLYVIAIILIGIVVFYFSIFLSILPTIMLLVMVGVVYLAYKMVIRINMEYEYLIVNYDLDIDKIISGRLRKRIDTINLRRIDDFGFSKSLNEQKYLNNPQYKKIYACADRKNGYAFIIYSNDGGKKMLFFTPNEEIVDYIKKVNPGKFE